MGRPGLRIGCIAAHDLEAGCLYGLLDLAHVGEGFHEGHITRTARLIQSRVEGQGVFVEHTLKQADHDGIVDQN